MKKINLSNSSAIYGGALKGCGTIGAGWALAQFSVFYPYRAMWNAIAGPCLNDV